MTLEETLLPIVERDSLLFEDVLRKHDTAVRDTLVHSPYPMTGRAVFMFYLKSSFLKNAILATCQSEDSYSSKILYRSYIEHYLRHRYLLFKFLEVKSDEPGNDYYHFAMLEEGIRFLYGVNKSNQIHSGTVGKIDLSEDIEALLQRPEYKGISKAEALSKSAQFEYKQILSYFRQARSATTTPEIPFFRWLVADYAELSSYVHGGPWAEDDLNKQSLDDSVVQNLFAIAKKAFNMHCTLAEATFFFAKVINPEFANFKEIFKSYLL